MIELARHKIPFEFQDQSAFLDTLYGRDEPEALADIRWDPIPQLSPVTEDQLIRIKKAEQLD